MVKGEEMRVEIEVLLIGTGAIIVGCLMWAGVMYWLASVLTP